MAFSKTHGYAVSVALVVVAIGVLFAVPLFSLDRQSPGAIEEYDASVEEGRYLARAGNCVSCHTAAEGEPFAGGVEFRTPFGVLYSTNITQDEGTGIGSWTFEDFYQSMKYGVRPDGTHLYPAFPYTDFASMTDADLASLWLYMQTLEPVEAPARANELGFPYSSRALLGPWKALFHDPAAREPDPARSAEWNRGRYLVEGPGHCGACHTPRNALGAENEGLALTGGVHMDRVKFGNYRQWSAVNLTPADSGLAAWSEKDIVDYLKTGKSDRAIVHGPMTEVVMNSTSHLTEEDLQAMATYLKGVPAREQDSGPEPDEETLATGEIVYTVHCGSCHLPTGKGDAGLGIPLEKNPTVQAPDPASLINVILYGPHLPARPFSVDRSNMEMFGKRLSDEDIAAVASFVRNSFGNRAGVVTPEQVEKQR